MEFSVLPNDIEVINQQLIRHFGIDTDTGKPMWRISWSNDQTEKRRDNVTPSGIRLLFPTVMEAPKYPWIKDRWILERLVLVPEVNQTDLPSQKQSYECMYAFEHTQTHGMIQPSFAACKFIVDTIYASMGKSSLAKYVDEEAKNPLESREKRINKLQEELFGDESSLLGRTITGEAITVPQMPQKE